MFVESLIVVIGLWLIAFIMIFFHKHPSPTNVHIWESWYFEKSRLVVRIIGMIFLTVVLVLFVIYGFSLFNFLTFLDS